VTLPIWILLAAGATWFAPSAAYLWTVPLLVAGACLIGAFAVPQARIPDHRFRVAIQIASIIVLAITGTLWLRNTVDLLQFATAVFGRLPLIMPVYVFAAIIAAAGLMVAAPIRRPALVTGLSLTMVAIATGVAALAPAYTYEHPLRRHVRALQEQDSPTAIWEIASIEPGVDLAVGAPVGWTLQKDAVSANIPWGRFSNPFVFRTRAESLGPAPADVTGFTITPGQGTVDISTSVVPRRSALAISFVLPSGLSPSHSNLPGALRLGQWVATFVAPPAEGIAWRATFTAADTPRLADVRVVVTDSGFPGGIGWQRLPAWLPQDRAVWTATATWVLPLPPPGRVEPAGTLR
jgi:hypothetical protein